MFRLIQIVKNTSDEKEVQSTYDYEDRIEAKGEYETKLGNNMKSDLYSAVLMILLDNEGDIVDKCKYDKPVEPAPSEEGEEEQQEDVKYSFQPRLFEVKVTNEEIATLSKYDSTDEVSANFHSKWGAAIKNNQVRAEMLRGFDGNGGTIEFTYWVRPTTEEG
jgi:hypothetical protein